MKKLLLSLSMMIGLVQISSAQITITDANAPAIGYSTYRAEDENPPSSIDLSTVGANAAWDFSGLSAYTATFLQLDVVTPSSVVDHGVAFPNANFAVSTSDGTNLFMNSDASGMYAAGLGGPFDIQGFPLIVTLPFADPQQLISFPCTYQTAFTDTLFFDLLKDSVLPGIVDSARVKRFQTITSEIDAWGVITTPSMSAVSCLREHRVEISIDSVWAEAPGLGFSFDTLAVTQRTYENVYNFYIQDNNLPVVEIRTDSAGSVQSVHFLADTANCCVDGIKENPASIHFNVFPNPTADFMNVYTTFTEKSSMELYDMTGKLVLSQGINQPQNRYNVSSLANGLYVYRILDKNGILIKSDKIQVQK